MEFRLSTSARIAGYIVGTLFFTAGIFLIIYAFYSQLYFVFIGPLLIGIGWYLFKEIRSSCLILNDDSITLVNSRSFRTLPLNDMQGYRRLQKGGFEILPASLSAEKKMTISSSFENSAEIASWLAEHIPDIDAVTIQQETESILNDEHFGLSETDRSKRLQQAKQVAKLLNAIAFIAVLWGFLYPDPYSVLLVLLLVLPFIAFAVIRYFNGLVQMADGRKSAYPSVVSAVLVPPMVLVVRALLDFSIYDYALFFKPAIIILLIALAIAWWCCRDMINRTAQRSATLITLLVSLCCYAYGATITVNGWYDDKPATKVFTVAVKGKHISTGKHTSYYLLLDAWGRYTNPEDVAVSSNLYNEENEGDAVNVYLKKGYLGVPWFWVDKAGTP